MSRQQLPVKGSFTKRKGSRAFSFETAKVTFTFDEPRSCSVVHLDDDPAPD
jgi:hypothetical protein